MSNAFHKPRTTLFAVISFFIMASTGWAATYYISPTGNDSTGNGSQASPWKTLSTACSKVTAAGNTIYINSGSYSDNNRCNLAPGVNIQGAGKTQVTITSAYGGGMGTGYIFRETAQQNPLAHGNNEISGFTLDGSGKTLVTGIFLRGTDNLNIHDIRFQNIKSDAIILAGYWNWTNYSTTPPPTYAQNVIVHDIDTNDTTTEADLGWGPRQGSIQLLGLQGAKVYNLNINENYTGRGVGVKCVPGWLKGLDAYNWTIRTNPTNTDAFVFEMYNFSGDSQIYNSSFNHMLSLNSGPQTLDSGSSWNLKIHDTTTDFSGFPIGATSGHELSHNHLDFYNNFVNGGSKISGGGLWTTNYLTASSVTHWRVRNNVFYNCASAGLTIQRGALSNVEIYNNVFDTIASSPWGGYGIDTEMFSGSLSGAKIQNNLFMNCRAAGININAGMSNTLIDHNWFYNNGNSNNVVSSAANTTQTNNSKGTAPGINSSGNRPDPYYRPSSATSNLVDAGINVGLPYSGSAPPIGAYEYSSTSTATLSAPSNLRVVN